MKLRHLGLIALAPLALGLAACNKGSSDAGTAELSGAPIAAVAPPAGKTMPPTGSGSTRPAPAGPKTGQPEKAPH